MAFKAESNIVTAAGVIHAGESFNPDTYKMPRKEVERLISIGAVTRGASERKPVIRETAADDPASAVDSDDRRNSDHTAGK